MNLMEKSVVSGAEIHPVDMHIGSRVRLARMAKGVGQEWLGEQVGKAFQQIQKYEKGTNRLSGSVMYAIANALEVPVSYFFEGLDDDESKPDHVISFVEEVTNKFAAENHKQFLILNRAFSKIKKHSTRKHIIALVRELAGDNE